MAKPAGKKRPDTCDACNGAFEPDPVTKKYQWLTVENFKLHPKCFKCKKCDTPIDQNSKYHKKDDGTYLCINCTRQDYGGKAQVTDEENAGKCFACNQALGAAWTVDANKNQYHNDCFKCLTCKKGLADGYSSVGDKVYCKGCRQKQLDAEQ